MRGLRGPLVAAEPNLPLAFFDGPVPDAGEWRRRLADADAVLLSRFGVVSFAGTGAAKYADLAAARRGGVTVCKCRATTRTLSPSARSR
jgi:hypothetical protein